jgi:hypothetical protein
MNSGTKGLPKDTDLSENYNKSKVKNRELRKKILSIFLKVIRWPILLLGIPFLSFYLPYVLSGEENFLKATTNDTVFFTMVGGFIFGTVFSGIIGALITKSFISTTGIAALIYIVTSFFIKNSSMGMDTNPYENNISFENTKLLMIALMIALIFIGDLIALVGRLIRNRIGARKFD